MNMINKIYKLAILVVGLSVFIPSESWATHIVGGNLTYRHISGTTYQVRLTLRRDCLLGSPEAQFDDPASIGIFTSSGALAIWVGNNGQLKIPFMSSDTLNQYIRSDCGFEGTQVCVHETIYQGNISLPERPGGYILAYQRCCRNATINNILNPLETGSTYWVAVSEQALVTKNTSPEFKEWPDVYICANKPLVFDHSAKDANGDSLVYKLCIPSTGATLANPKPQPPGFPPYVNIQWAPPYSLNDMMGGVPLKIDSKTGVITANPNLVGQFLIGICVEEYRNGVLLGTVRRDFQYNVRVCSQPPKAQFTTSESNCDGLRVEFYNNSLSSSAYQWDFNYPSSNPAFKSTEKNPVFTFPQSGIYTVRLRATRGSDGCFDTLLQTVSVFENKIIPQFSYRLDGCNDRLDSLTLLLNDESAFNEPGYNLDSWSWSVTQHGQTRLYSGKEAKVLVDTNGIATVTLSLTASNGCKTEIEKQVDIQQFIPKLDFDYRLVQCPSEGVAQIELTDKSGPLNPNAIIETTSWTVGNQTLTGGTVLVNIPQDTKSFEVNMSTLFKSACRVELTKSFDLSVLVPSAAFTFDPVGCPDVDSVTYRLTYDGNLSNGQPATNLEWMAGIASGQSAFSGNQIEFTIPKDSLAVFSLMTVFENGCIDRLADTLWAGPFADLQFPSDSLIICAGEARDIVINANPDWQYTWSPDTGLDLSDPAHPRVIGTTNQNYSVTVSDGLCSVNGSIEIVVLSGGVVLAVEADTISCDGKVNLSASGGIGEGVYSWGTNPGIDPVIATGNDVNTTFTGASQTFYVRFVGDQCSTEPAFVKIYNQKPSVDDLSPHLLCPDDTVKIITINEIAAHQLVYNWKQDVHIVSGGNTSSPTITAGLNEQQPFVLYYTATNQYGCVLEDSVLVKIGINPVVDFTYDLKACGDLQICFETQGNYQGFIKWDFGDPNANNDTSIERDPCYTYTDSGSFTVSLSNLVGTCPFKDVNKTIIVNPRIRINELQDTVLCKGDTINLLASANLQDVKYTWYDAANNILATTPGYSGSFPASTQLTVIGEDIYGCKDTASVNVNYFKFDYSVNVKDSLCVSEPTAINLNLANSQAYGIAWSPAECIVSGGTTTNPVVLPVEGKTIKLVVRHLETGCADSTSVTPKVTKPFDFAIDTADILCFAVPTNVHLDILNPEKYNYEWTPAGLITSGGNTTDPVVNLEEDQLFTVKVTDKLSGCQKIKDVLVRVGDEVFVDVNAEPDLTIYEGESIEIVVQDPVTGSSYVWSNGNSGTTITVDPVTTTTYTVTVTDSNGCTATDEVVIEVRTARCDETDVFVPNAFTPNNDGNNDIFRVRSNFIDELEMLVYDRWGQEVFRTTDPAAGWDGTFKGVELAPDAYAYYIRVRCINSVEYKKKGNVTLLR